MGLPTFVVSFSLSSTVMTPLRQFPQRDLIRTHGHVVVVRDSRPSR